MSKPAFFTDEDIYAAVAVALRKAGLDAVSTPEAGRLGESDDSQLAWATHQGRTAGGIQRRALFGTPFQLDWNRPTTRGHYCLEPTPDW